MSVLLAFASPEYEPRNVEWLNNGTAAMAYAGPDAQRVWLSDNGESARTPHAGLGHAQLHDSIDEASTQPLSFDNAVWITGDVRLDDRTSLIHALNGAGRTLAQRADDSSLVLHAYLAWGTDCMSRLAGDFAFAIWDDRAKMLFCARDQMGAVPLFYAESQNRVQVSNAMFALQRDDRIRDAVDEQTIGDFLLWGYGTSASATMLSDIHQVPSGHTLTWKAGRVSVTRYWSVPEWDGYARFATAADYSEHFRFLLQQAVADRTRAPSVGLQLSGGMDSTSVAALAKRVAGDSPQPISLRAYTLTLHAITADREGEFAQQVANDLQIPLELIDVSNLPDIDPLATPTFATPEPGLFRRTALEAQIAYRPATRGRVALTGLGGDVLLAHVPTWWMDWLGRGEFRRVIGAFTMHRRLFGRLPLPGIRTALRHRAMQSAMADVTLPPWIPREFVDRTNLNQRARQFRIDAPGRHHAPGLAESAEWSALLSSGHPAFTGVPLRFRHPLHDLRLLKFTIALPPRPWLMDKYLMREAARGLLPESVRTRPKVPLGLPSTHLLQSARGVHAGVDEMISRAPDLDRWVNRATLRQTLDSSTPLPAMQRRTQTMALGLAHWLLHRRRTKSVGVNPNGTFAPTTEARTVAVP